MLNKLKHIYHLYKLKTLNKGFNYVFLKGDNNGNKLLMNVDNTWLQQCIFTFEGKNNVIEIDSGCQLTGVWFFLKGDNNHLMIGKNTYIYSSYAKQTMISPCYGTKIAIGDNCLFANDIEVQTTDHHHIYENGVRTNNPQDIIIGNHCWIGAHSSILKGTSIPDNCVVGAKSLVNRKFPDMEKSIIAGIPAKVVKINVEWKL